MADHQKTVLITSMRNEAPYVLEWLAYHRLIGVDDFLIYSNDCDDGTDALLARLDDLGIVTHVRNEVQPKGVQWSALKAAEKHPLVKGADWLLFSDVDEFVNIKVGNGRLSDLWSAVPNADAFALQWRLFGNAGMLNIGDDLVTETFDRCAPMPVHAPWQASQIKTLFRNDGRYRGLGVHRPRQRKGDVVPVWVNGSGKRLPEQFADKGIVTYGGFSGADLVQLNHYALKSAKGFLVKSDRGLPNRAHKEIGLEYWADRNFNEAEDTSIKRFVAPVRELIDDWLQDTALADLHRAGLAWHQSKADEIAQTQDGMELLTRLMTVQRFDLPEKDRDALVGLRISVNKRLLAQGKTPWG